MLKNNGQKYQFFNRSAKNKLITYELSEVRILKSYFRLFVSILQCGCVLIYFLHDLELQML